jgi:hypothetical protein
MGEPSLRLPVACTARDGNQRCRSWAALARRRGVKSPPDLQKLYFSAVKITGNFVLELRLYLLLGGGLK